MRINIQSHLFKFIVIFAIPQIYFQNINPEGKEAQYMAQIYKIFSYAVCHDTVCYGLKHPLNLTNFKIY